MLGRFCLIDALCAKGILNQRIIYCFTLDVSCLGISRVASDCIKNHLLAWEHFVGRKVKNKEEGCFGSTLYHFWSIWRERETQRVFEGVQTPFQCLKDNFIKPIYFWDNGKCNPSSFDVARDSKCGFGRDRKKLLNA